ncbi:unnamed protein product [Prunus armeniaca]
MSNNSIIDPFGRSCILAPSPSISSTIGRKKTFSHFSSPSTWAAIHAKAEYFNSKCIFVCQSWITCGDPPQASAHPKPNHYTPTNYAQGGQNPRRKDYYQRSFNNGKRSRHSNTYQFGSYSPPKVTNRALLPFEPKPRFEVFTMLNTTYEHVLVNDIPIIPKPHSRRPTTKPMSDTGVFYLFHQFNGHDIESCITLRNIIESFIWEGKLDKYVHNIPPSRNPHQRQINTISTISGGPPPLAYPKTPSSIMSGLPMHTKSSTPSMDTCRRCPEEAGTLLPADYSSGQAFNELQVLDHLLDQSMTPVMSFSGDVVQPIRSIHLPISIGLAPQRAMVFISTHMLMLKFPTLQGTGTVRGKQLKARSCYALAVKSTSRPL